MPPTLEFLSPAWIEALAAAGRKISVDPGVRLTVQQVVRRQPAGDVRFSVSFRDGAVHVRPGQAESADVTLTQGYDVAVALSRGEINAQAALASGVLKLSGALDRVLRHAAALTALDDVFADVRARTSYE